MASSVSRRFIIGLVFVAVSLMNLAANSYWLRTGDVHRPNFHAVMRGGWAGFWLTTGLFSGLLVVGLALLALEFRSRRRAGVQRST